MQKTALITVLAAQLVLQSCYSGPNTSNKDPLGVIEQQYAENPEAFPPWIQPYIRPTAILSHLLVDDSNPLPAKEIEQAVQHQLECLQESQASFDKLINMINAQFGLHRANMVLNSAMACDRARKSKSIELYEDVWQCGNEPRFPFGPKWLELIEHQANLYIELAPEYFRLGRKQVYYLIRNIENQLDSFEQFQEQPCR